MKKLMLCVIVALSACGVDGEPIQPKGGVKVGLNGNGIGIGANVGLKKGPLRVGLGL